MRSSHRFSVVAAAVACLPACGIPTEQYDARVKELRFAEEKNHTCDRAIGAERERTTEAQADLEEMRSLVKDMKKERQEMGIHTAADLARVRSVLGEATRNRGQSQAAQVSAAGTRAERDRLSQNLRAEVSGGVVTIDERGGLVRMTLPEEALFGPTNAKIGAAGQKVLDAIAREIKAMPSREVLVYAFVDRTEKSKGDKDMALTLDRAWHVCDYFTTKQGVDKAAVAAAGMGGLQPIADNANDSLRPRNRRVEIVLGAPVPQGSTMTSGGAATGAGSGKQSAASRGGGLSDDPGL